MSEPLYGQRSNPSAAPMCTRHPDRRSVTYCKNCNRPCCAECAIPTEVGSICVDCAGVSRKRIQKAGPIVTYGIIGLCALMFVADYLTGHSLYQALAFQPRAAYGQLYRFVTTAFLHAGLWHIAFNMLALWMVGTPIEKTLGHWRFAVLYLLSALGGSIGVLAWCFVSPASFTTVTVGASGAVFGLFAAVFVLQRLNRQNTTAVLVLLGVNLVYGFMSPGISWQAHVGGMITGALVAWALLTLLKPKPGKTAVQQERKSVVASVGMAAFMVVLIAAMYNALGV